MKSHSEHLNELFGAMAKFRSQLVQPAKDSKNPYFKSDYVSLEGVMNAVDKAINGTGLSYIQEVTSDESTVSVSTVILHESGQFLEQEPLTIPASKKDAQGFGSSNTYARRYSLETAFGISAEIDDDGNAGTEAVKKQIRNQKSSPKPVQKEVTKTDTKVKEIMTLSADYSRLQGKSTKEQFKADYVNLLGEYGLSSPEEFTPAIETKIIIDLRKKIKEVNEVKNEQVSDPFETALQI